MKIEPMTSLIGAEIIGANLGNLSVSEFEVIHDAFTKHIVFCISVKCMFHCTL